MADQTYYEDEIDLADLLRVLLKRKKIILGLVFFGTLLTAVISLIMTPIYQSKAVIAPVQQQQGLGGAGAMLAAQFGISMPPSGNVAELVSLLKSNVLREKVIKRLDLIGGFFKPEDLKDKTDLEKLWEALRYMEKAMKVDFKTKDNIVEVSMEFKDPEMAKKIVDVMLEELQNHMSQEAKRVAETNRRYLEEALSSTSDPFIKSNIYNLIAQQIQQGMLAEAKENFAFKIIDPPKVPDKKVKPKRRVMVMVAFVTTLFGGIFLAFFMEYLQGLKTRLKQDKTHVKQEGAYEA